MIRSFHKLSIPAVINVFFVDQFLMQGFHGGNIIRF